MSAASVWHGIVVSLVAFGSSVCCVCLLFSGEKRQIEEQTERSRGGGKTTPRSNSLRESRKKNRQRKTERDRKRERRGMWWRGKRARRRWRGAAGCKGALIPGGGVGKRKDNRHGCHHMWAVRWLVTANGFPSNRVCVCVCQWVCCVKDWHHGGGIFFSSTPRRALGEILSCDLRLCSLWL